MHHFVFSGILSVCAKTLACNMHYYYKMSYLEWSEESSFFPTFLVPKVILGASHTPREQLRVKFISDTILQYRSVLFGFLNFHNV